MTFVLILDLVYELCHTHEASLIKTIRRKQKKLSFHSAHKFGGYCFGYQSNIFLKYLSI